MTKTQLLLESLKQTLHFSDTKLRPRGAGYHTVCWFWSPIFNCGAGLGIIGLSRGSGRNMSYTLLSQTRPKARKAHRCIWCGQEITKGCQYIAERSVFLNRTETKDHLWRRYVSSLGSPHRTATKGTCAATAFRLEGFDSPSLLVESIRAWRGHPVLHFGMDGCFGPLRGVSERSECNAAFLLGSCRGLYWRHLGRQLYDTTRKNAGLHREGQSISVRAIPEPRPIPRH